jgi:DNA-binding response OmpR family regulator
MKKACAGAVSSGMARRCVSLAPMSQIALTQALQKSLMIKLALATSCEVLARKVSRALSGFESVVSRHQAWSALPSARELKSFDLIVVHHQDEGWNDEMQTRYERNLPSSTPAMAIISDQHLECSVPLLNAGIDRCLPESFDESHFSAVVRALTRRRHGLASSVGQYGGVSFNHETKQTWMHDKEIELTKREAQVLDILLKRVGQIVPKEDFIEEMGPDNFDLNACAVEVYIHRLRKKIKSEYLPIRNIKRCGYFLRRFEPLSETSAYISV